MNKINLILRSIIKFFGSVRLALGTILTVGMMLAVAALLLFAWTTDEVFEGDAANFDTAIRNYVHGFSNPTLTSVMQAASFLGSTLFLVLLGTALVAGFLIYKHRRRAIIFTITTLGASILIWTLKHIYRRPRPEAFFNTILPSSDSFPSGHSLGSFCFYGALAAIIINRTESLKLQILVFISAAALILLIGISRVYLGVHYPSDVIAGFVIGFIWVTTAAIGDKLLRTREAKKQTNTDSN